MNEIIVNRTQEFFKSPTPMQKKLMNDVDSLFLCGKSENSRVNRLRVARTDDVWQQPFLPARGDGNKVRTINGKPHSAPAGRQWGMSQESVDEYSREGRIKVDENGRVLYSPMWRNIKNNWTDIPGYARTWSFATENAEQLLHRSLSAMTSEGSREIVMDFFAGSGTTLAVAQKLGRKWIGVELGAHFDTVILPRLKKVLAGVKTGVSRDVDYAGGGAFMYCEMEQYEDTLRRMRDCYGDTSPVVADEGRSVFGQYVFLADEKLSGAAFLEGGGIGLDFSKLYDDISLAETLANARGVFLRGRTGSEAIFSDGVRMKLDSSEMTDGEKREVLRVLRPYLWWGE